MNEHVFQHVELLWNLSNPLFLSENFILKFFFSLSEICLSFSMFKTRHLHLCCLLLGLPTSQCWKERQCPEEEETRILWLHPAILRLSKWWTPSGYIQTGIKPLRHAHIDLFCHYYFDVTTIWFPGGEGWNERGTGVTNVFPQHKSQTQGFLYFYICMRLNRIWHHKRDYWNQFSSFFVLSFPFLVSMLSVLTLNECGQLLFT